MLLNRVKQSLQRFLPHAWREKDNNSRQILGTRLVLGIVKYHFIKYLQKAGAGTSPCQKKIPVKIP
jgi:hypothetical protein